MLILTRVFCVLLYARVRLRDTAFETHLRSWSFAWRSSYLSLQSSSWLVQRSHLLHWRLQCIWTIRLHFSNSNVYSSFMKYYSLPIPLHYITLCLWSVIGLFTVYFRFCQIKLTIRYFELFKSDMYGFIVDLNGPK